MTAAPVIFDEDDDVAEDEDAEGTKMGDKQYAAQKIEGFGARTKPPDDKKTSKSRRPRRREPALNTLLGKAATGVITGGELEALAQWFVSLRAVCAGMQDIPRLKFVMLTEDNSSHSFVCVPAEAPCAQPCLVVVLDE